MNKKIDYFKKFWLVALLFDSPYITVLYILAKRLFSESYLMQIGTIIFLMFLIVMNTMDKWYLNDRVEELENKFKVAKED